MDERKQRETQEYHKEYEKYFVENIDMEKDGQSHLRHMEDGMSRRHNAPRKRSAAEIRRNRLIVELGLVVLLVLAIFVLSKAVGGLMDSRKSRETWKIEEIQADGKASKEAFALHFIAPGVQLSTVEPAPPPEAIIRTPAEEEVKEPSFFDGAVFVGDSITQGLMVYSVLENSTVIATKGMGLSETYDHFGELKEANPKRLFLLLGINDLADYYKTPEQIAERYVTLYNDLRRELPDCRIYVETMLPVAEKYDNSRSQVTNDKINAFNAVLKEKIANRGVYYMNLNPSFKGSDGYMYDEITGDGMHLKKSYYGYWMNLIIDNTKQLEETFQ